MLVGSFKHTIDAKGRVFLPAKYREDLGHSILLIKGSHECLIALSESQWQKVLEDMEQTLDKEEAADTKRKLMKKSQLIEPDTQGRIVVSAEMREIGNLKKDIVFLGMDNFVEIWDAELLNEADSAEEEAKNNKNIKKIGL